MTLGVAALEGLDAAIASSYNYVERKKTMKGFGQALVKAIPLQGSLAFMLTCPLVLLFSLPPRRLFRDTLSRLFNNGWLPDDNLVA